MALESLSKNSKIIVYNSDTDLISASRKQNSQGIKVKDIVKVALPKIYRATLTTGGDVVNVFENNIGEDIVWTTSATGEITSDQNLNIPYDISKVFISTSAKFGGSGTIATVGVNFTGDSTNGGSVAIYTQEAGVAANATLFIEIYVYS
jgi:hypothetical protein